MASYAASPNGLGPAPCTVKAFMRCLRLRSMGGTWATLLRLPGDTYLEAFEIYKSFF
jgi:hypothetical protein